MYYYFGDFVLVFLGKTFVGGKTGKGMEISGGVISELFVLEGES